MPANIEILLRPHMPLSLSILLSLSLSLSLQGNGPVVELLIGVVSDENLNDTDNLQGEFLFRLFHI